MKTEIHHNHSLVLLTIGAVSFCTGLEPEKEHKLLERENKVLRGMHYFYLHIYVFIY